MELHKTTKPVISITGVSTRSKTASLVNQVSQALKRDTTSTKRKAGSPVKNVVKRPALGDITNDATGINKNNALKKSQPPVKKVTVHQKIIPTLNRAALLRVKQNDNVTSVKTVARPKPTVTHPPPVVQANKVQTRASLKNNTSLIQTTVKPAAAPSTRSKTRLSNEFEKTGESLYASALEDSNVSTDGDSGEYYCSKSSSNDGTASVTLVAQQMEKHLNLSYSQVPEDVNDFDKENWDDIFQVSEYAGDLFNYFKSKESSCMIKDYMSEQICVTKWMRSLLVDWMVEIQESFELNHETLYLGVKLVDMYLSKVGTTKEMLQLVGATAMFIASKFDERLPPLVDDFLYVCDGAYARKELIRMEMNMLKVCNFNLGIPLSYRFLRRYARCAKVTMPVLTLARFILENSLMDYATVTLLDSKVAAAALYLALQMKKISGWTPTLQYYTGYKLEDIISVVHLLNDWLSKTPKEHIKTVRNKYSHEVFFEVAKTPLIKNENLQP